MKKVPIYKIETNKAGIEKSVLVGWRDMTKQDVEKYFNSITPLTNSDRLEQIHRAFDKEETKLLANNKVKKAKKLKKIYEEKLNNFKEYEYFCNRCGILIGKKFGNKKKFEFNGFDLCGSCLEQKQNKEKECTPDIEDIERFDVVRSNLFLLKELK